jgi:deoxycytidylate deaminase
LERFFELFFGNRFHTPNIDEHGMYMARAAALRSADLNRQVGAAIFNKIGDVISIGCNDVPKASGDLYWPEDKNDARDFKYGFDSSATQRELMLGELLGRLQNKNLLHDSIGAEGIKELVQSLISGERKEDLKGAAFMNLLEFGRSVHAEMAALMAAARQGLSVKGATLFCTTFPCHMCARHIVASGIDRVVYVEPYPKSRAKQLHKDSISVDAVTPSHQHVNFEPFTGVAPRQYITIFEAGDDRKDAKGRVAAWRMSTGRPRFSRFLSTYIDLEKVVIAQLPFLRSRLDKKVDNEPVPQPSKESPDEQA